MVKIPKYTLREVVVELTARCNLSCLHCGSSCKKVISRKELSVSDWKLLINQLVKMKTQKIHFSGGEPILKRGFAEIIAYADQKIKFSVLSNGLFLNCAHFRLFKQYRPFTVGISLDGLKETHNRIRNNGKSFDRVMRSILGLKNSGLEVCVITTVNKFNFNELLPMAWLINHWGVDSWQIQLTLPFGRAKENAEELLIDELMFKETCLNIVRLRRGYPKINIVAADCFSYAPENLIRPKKWHGCGCGLVGCGINAYGDVLSCLSLQTGPSKGDSIKTKPLKDIWNNSPIFDFNRKFNPENVEGECKDCSNLLDCHGGCASQSFAYSNRYHCAPFCFWRTFSKAKEEK